MGSEEEKISLLNFKQSPLIAIVIAIVVAVIMTAFSFKLFLNSSAQDTIKSFSQNIDTSSNTSIEINSPLTETSVDQVLLKIQTDLGNLDDSADFNADELNNSYLGL